MSWPQPRTGLARTCPNKLRYLLDWSGLPFSALSLPSISGLPLGPRVQSVHVGVHVCEHTQNSYGN